MKKILNALFLTIITLVTFSCSDVPAPYDINGGGNGEGPALTGDGTKENPYDIASAMTKQDNSEAWVMGYIVGCINDKSISTDAVFAPPFTNAANILIAADADETDYKKCIPVQLVSQTDVRAALNLVDNGGNLGKAVVIKGQLTKYFGVAGLKSPTAAVLDGKDIGDGGDPEPGDKDNPLGLDDSKKNNTFSADFEDLVANSDYELEGWYNVAVEGGRRWQGKTFNNTTTGKTDKYIQATSYGGTGEKFECWFATPAFEVDQVKDKKVSFDCAVYNYATASANSKLEVYFLQLVDGKMVSTAINVAGMPTTDNTWVSLTADLSAQAGKTGFVGFKYTSTSSSEALSYRLDNIKAGQAEGGEDPDPSGETVAVTKDQSYEETFASAFGKFTIDNKELGGLEAVWTIDASYKCAIASAFKDAAGIVAESWLVSPIIDMTSILSTDDINLSFTQMSQKQGDANEYMLKIKNVSDNGAWENLTFEQPEAGFKAMLVNIKLQVYAGKKIQLAFVYKNAKTDSAPKWEIQNVKIGVTPGVPGGTEDDPLTCAEVIALNNTAAGPYYVKGYIIGFASSATSFVFSNFTDKQNTNIVIADSKTETETTKCVIVKLPNGDMRSGLNLYNNPTNLGKLVSIKSTLGAYFKVPGLTNPTEYKFVE